MDRIFRLLTLQTALVNNYKEKVCNAGKSGKQMKTFGKLFVGTENSFRLRVESHGNVEKPRIKFVVTLCSKMIYF